MFEDKNAIVVLPEIFGVNGFIKATVERLAATHKAPAYPLDFFSPVTRTHKVYDYVADREEAHDVMTKVTPEIFVPYFKSELDKIQAENSEITSFTVVGFCFGGNLAYLAGTDPRVSKIVSYYGGRAAGSVQMLIYARKENKPRILALFGGTDSSIPESDRAATKNALVETGFGYTEKVYDGAGHAFANFERTDRYHEASAQDASKIVDEFIAA